MYLRLAALLLCLLACALTRAADAPDEDARRLIQLGPGDSVTVEVYGQPDMTTTVYVSDDGAVNLPLVGAVKISGLSPVDAGKKVEGMLKSGGLLNDPHVTVALVQSRSQRVAVLGEVHTPGRYTIEPNTTIFDLLAQAGGATADSAEFAYVLHPDSHGGMARSTVKLGDFAGARDMLAIKTLQGGDTLYVPHADRFYVYGEVNSPNMYRLEPGMTVLQAISRAGGITARGSERRIQIKRATGKNGEYAIIHPQPGDIVQPDDVIRVKESIF
jgi:polysaccharide export outer membrane protein